MSETPDLVRHLYDHCVTTGGLTETDWQRFKRDHPMTSSRVKEGSFQSEQSEQSEHFAEVSVCEQCEHTP